MEAGLSKQVSARQKLIQATLDSLMDEGMDGYSVRKICQRAGVSTGLINYHFGSIQELVSHAYFELANGILQVGISAAQGMDKPRAKFSEFLRATFSSNVTERRILRAWLVFWVLIDTVPSVQAIQKETNQAFILFLQDLFRTMHSNEQLALQPSLAATGLSALIDGLWLELCLSSGSLNAEQCIELCEVWIDSALNDRCDD